MKELTEHNGHIDLAARTRANGHNPCVVWFTGLSGSGKSTLAFALEQSLFNQGVQVYTLDGDNVRLGLNSDLDFSMRDRTENLRRIAEVSRLMNQAGLVILAAFISPLESDRALVRSIVGDHNFLEIYVSTPLETCISRDPKGLYKKAIEGKIAEFTGISAAYEAPLNADLSIDTTEKTSEEIIHQLAHVVLQKINWNV
jgi:adenylyl-sulfate kinase